MIKNDCRSTLMEVGTRLFAERGLNGVSIRELSRAAGASISMISYYFGGKEGLYSAVLREQFVCFDEIEAIRRQGAEPLAMIEAYIRWTIQRHRSNPYLLRFYTSELTNPTPYFATIVSPAIGKVIRILMEIVDEGIAGQQFRSDLHPGYGVLALAGMVNYFFLSMLATENLISHSPDKDEELIQQYIAIFANGILGSRT
ncbi:TetR/AcrR family transcriptional regulator [Geobacter argillaceus]|uniref:TetR family transcriptional regulator n=1 Tax=Geobacter argillaceus TaxID=345631 RepID=A0A562VN51_9BACT|nr:TetR/AcrR family transcriptional regulator [Geobacter argillaceus]TWJ19201.1 TetR family transcriptional regulator [Geobacter argillaceus]